MKIHYLYTAIRSQPPQVVFAAILLGCEMASSDPRFVGVNIAAPEDGRVSMRDYHLHMQFFDYLHSIYPKVNFTLHAGELAPGLVPPEGLRSNIRQAVELGHAKRIGHGVDVLYEDDAQQLLAEMAAKHIMVEINLTSNDGILGVKGKDHPLSGYRAAHVPVALSSDDEGVSREGRRRAGPRLHRPQADGAYAAGACLPLRRQPVGRAGRLHPPQSRLRRTHRRRQQAHARMRRAAQGKRTRRRAVGARAALCCF
jgi:hypothetical protein